MTKLVGRMVRKVLLSGKPDVTQGPEENEGDKHWPRLLLHFQLLFDWY